MTDRRAIDRWMAAAADGDRAAVEPLFRALWPAVRTYAARLVGDDALGEDCAQEAIARLFGQLARYERGRDGLTWALSIATWECRTQRRARQRRGEVGSETAPDAALDGARAAEERDLIRAALAALDSLAAADRDVIAAALTDDDALREQLAPATFRKRLERALARLRTSWRSRHGTL